MPRNTFDYEIIRLYELDPGKTNADKRAEIDKILWKHRAELMKPTEQEQESRQNDSDKQAG